MVTDAFFEKTPFERSTNRFGMVRKKLSTLVAGLLLTFTSSITETMAGTSHVGCGVSVAVITTFSSS